jgi:hypothetical protein
MGWREMADTAAFPTPPPVEKNIDVFIDGTTT